jgi:glycosyltransferase involved in cell wall biosynthesis
LGSILTYIKRVHIFTLNYYPRFIGGAEVAIKEITDRIKPEEIEFHAIALRNDSALPRESREGNVTVHRIGWARKNPSIADLQKFPLKYLKYWYQFGAYFAAKRLHRRYQFDGTWAMMAHSCGIPAGLFKRKYPRVPYLLTLQEGDPPEYIEKLAKPVWRLFKRGFTEADYLQAISTFLMAWGKRMGFHGEGAVIPNAVDTAKFAAAFSEEEIAAKRKELGKREGDVFMVTTSRPVHKNGVDTVIRALPLMPKEVSFLIYGIGPEEEKYRALAKELGVEERARFMGQIAHADMPLMLRACDIFIRPSRSEGMGNSFVEAMAAGLPVIATQEGGLSDFIFDDQRDHGHEMTAWAVDPDAPEQIADAVKRIRDNHPKTLRVTVAASGMVAKRYDWGLVSREMRELFGEMLHI